MARDEIFAMWNYDVIDINRRKTFFFFCSKRTLINNLPNSLAEILFNFDALMRNFREAFLCYAPSISRTLLFSDKAWVYKRHFVLDCNDCSIAQCLGVQHVEGSAALVIRSIPVAASLVTFVQQSGSSR